MARDARPDVANAILRAAGISYHRAGRKSEALEAWLRQHDLAEEIGLERVACDLKLTLASQNLDCGRVAEGRRWLARIPPLTGHSQDHTLEYAYVSIAADFALHEGDTGALIRLSDLCAQLPARDVSVRVGRWRAALHWIGRHLRGDSLNLSTMIHELTREQVPRYETGEVGDLEMTVLLTILRDRGRHDLARAEARKYLGEVRRAYPVIGFVLAELLERILPTEFSSPHRVECVEPAGSAAVV
jgi:hypothetical protein